jgi:predicted Zn-dependent peptidase
MYVNHPVRIDIAGTVESIAEITPELLYSCYNTFYNLNNMVLAVAGNVNAQKVEEICDRMLKPSRNINLETSFPDEPEGVGQKSITEKAEVGSPLFCIGFKSQPCEGAEYDRRGVAASILLKLIAGPSSALYQNLFDDGLVNSQFCYEEFSSTGSFFSVIFSGESRDPQEVYRRICQEIKRVKKEGFDKEAFEIMKKCEYGSAVRGLNNAENCAMGMTESYFNGSTVFDRTEILAKLTPEDCLNALDTLLNIENSAISVVEN